MHDFIKKFADYLHNQIPSLALVESTTKRRCRFNTPQQYALALLQSYCDDVNETVEKSSELKHVSSICDALSETTRFVTIKELTDRDKFLHNSLLSLDLDKSNETDVTGCGRLFVLVCQIERGSNNDNNNNSNDNSIKIGGGEGERYVLKDSTGQLDFVSAQQLEPDCLHTPLFLTKWNFVSTTSSNSSTANSPKANCPAAADKTNSIVSVGVAGVVDITTTNTRDNNGLVSLVGSNPAMNPKSSANAIATKDSNGALSLRSSIPANSKDISKLSDHIYSPANSKTNPKTNPSAIRKRSNDGLDYIFGGNSSATNSNKTCGLDCLCDFKGQRYIEIERFTYIQKDDDIVDDGNRPEFVDISIFIRNYKQSKFNHIKGI